jgi:cell surface protein SprA
MDLAENTPHIYNNIPAFQSTPGAPDYPAKQSNQLYDQLTSAYGLVRDVDQVTNAFDPLYPDFQIGRDFEKIENARKLNEREFISTGNWDTYHLIQPSILMRFWQLPMNTPSMALFKVGEFSTDGINAPQTLILKLIKGTTLSPRLPTWNLMMKNVYSLGSGKLERKDFELNVLYQDDKTGNSINYLPEGRLADQILLQVMGLDNLNSQLDREP